MNQEIQEAGERISGYVRETPVEHSIPLSARVGGEIYLKLENYQLTGSFKLRGAMNKLLLLDPKARERGVVAASSGNHGAAIAFGLRALNGRCTIFVPQGASPTKVEAIRGFGAEVRTEGDDTRVTEKAARVWAAAHHRTYVSPYNDLEVIAGQGTIALELWRQLQEITQRFSPNANRESRPLDAILLALGGGGLTSGVASFLDSISPGTEIVACSPVNSAVMYQSLQAGQILDIESEPTLSDGTAGGVEAGAITFELCRELIDHHILVTEDEIESALRYVLQNHQMLIEGAAAVPVAALLKEPERFKQRRVALVLCGANISMDQLARVLIRA